MAMDYVELPEQLRGKQGQTLRVRFTPGDVKLICHNLTPLQARGDGKVTPNKLGRLLVENDQDAYEQCLMFGLGHDDKKIDLVDVTRMLDKAVLERGMQYSELRRPLLRSLIKCGLAELEVYIKALDDAEGDQGNALTPVTTSPTRSSTPPSETDSVS